MNKPSSPVSSFPLKSTQANWSPIPLQREYGTDCHTTGLHRLPYAADQPSFISYLDMDKPTTWLETTAVDVDICAELPALLFLIQRVLVLLSMTSSSSRSLPHRILHFGYARAYGRSRARIHPSIFTIRERLERKIFAGGGEIRTADLPDAGRGFTHATTASPH